MTQDTQSIIQCYLYPKEDLVWSGHPNPEGFALYKMMRCGTLIYRMIIALTLAGFISAILDNFVLNFISFGLIFPFIAWGTIYWSRWAAYNEGKKTTYAITDQRILILYKHFLIESYTADDIEMVQINKLSLEFDIVCFKKIIKDDGKGSKTSHKIGLVAVPDAEQVAHYIQILWNRKGK